MNVAKIPEKKCLAKNKDIKRLKADICSIKCFIIQSHFIIVLCADVKNEIISRFFV